MKPKEVALNNLCSITDNIFDALRYTAEALVSSGKSIAPTLNFLESEDSLSITVVPPPGDRFQDTLSRIAEALYLYSPMKSHAVMITLNSDICDDYGNKISSALNTFTLSDDYAFFTTMPYTITSSNSIIWHSDQNKTEHLLDKQFEGLSKEMVNLFYAMTHIDHSPYPVQEILSYLTFVGTAFEIHAKIPIAYYDMGQ